MKTTIKVLVLLALMLASFSQHASAAESGNWKYKGESADASFYGWDPAGCIFTEVYIFGIEEVSQSVPEKRTVSPAMGVFVSQINDCTGQQPVLGYAFPELAKGDFQVSGDLSMATLKTTINFYDSLHGTYFDLFINLTWTAVGSPTRDTSTTHFRRPGCNVVARHSGTVRSAEAMGTVSDGITNFTPDPANGAVISSSREAQVSIGCE